MIRRIKTTLETFPIYFAFTHHERGPCFVEANHEMSRCCELRHALTLIRNPRVDEGAKVFRQIFALNLRASLRGDVSSIECVPE